MLPYKFRQSFTRVVPVFTIAALLGWTNVFFKIDENLFNTKVTLKIILAILNAILLYFIIKKQVP